MSLDKVCEGQWQLRLTTLYDQSDTGMLISHYQIFIQHKAQECLWYFQKINI